MKRHPHRDGYRVLVDRLWPRGIKKENAQIDKWLKEVAPSTPLRKWFDHQPDKWKVFLSKYCAELKGSGGYDELQKLAREHNNVTLVYGAKDEEHNQAAALKKFLT